MQIVLFISITKCYIHIQDNIALQFGYSKCIFCSLKQIHLLSESLEYSQDVKLQFDYKLILILDSESFLHLFTPVYLLAWSKVKTQECELQFFKQTSYVDEQRYLESAENRKTNIEVRDT